MTLKKTVVDRSFLPPVDPDIGGRVLRYRIVSEDRNKISQWSTPYFVSDDLFYSTSQIIVDKQSSFVDITWDPVKAKTSAFLPYSSNIDLAYVEDQYDVWVRWSKSDLGDWLFEERLSSTSIKLIIPDFYFYNDELIEDKPNQLTVEIRQATTYHTRDYDKGLFYNTGLQVV